MVSNATENVSRRDYDSFCHLCSYEGKTLKQFLSHQAQHMPALIKYKCDICERRFPTKEARKSIVIMVTEGYLNLPANKLSL